MVKKTSSIVPQPYPRIQDTDDPYYGYLDDSKLIVHPTKIAIEDLKRLIRMAIQKANRKSSREILSIPANATSETIQKTL
jgi:hypothetical protein